MNNVNVRRILVPLDFSAAGNCALQYGTYLANNYRADVFILHIQDDIDTYPKDWFTEKSPNKEMVKIKIMEKLREYAEDFTKKYGIYVQNIVTTGKAANKIIDAVEEHDIDLIVMGAHGIDGFEAVFIGHTAKKVVNLATCPVITIREGFQSDGVKSIVLPIDDTRYSRQKVTNVLPLATRCKSQIHILGFTQSDDKSDIAKLNLKLNTVQDAFQKAGLVCVRKMVNGANVAIESVKYAEEVHADLLSIMTDHESSLAGKFMGAFSRQIVNYSKVPVMSIKPIEPKYETSN